MKKKERNSIIKNTLNKIHLHPLCILLAFTCFITGLFKEFIIFSMIIIIHESGHYVMARYYNWQIDKIIFYPFGGYIKFNELINRPIKEEFIIALMGPFYQIMLYLFFYFLYYLNIINTNTFDLIYNYHYAILLFNLLPIHPLDGSKLFNLLINKFLPFKLSHKVTLYVSTVFILILIFFMLHIQYNFSFYLLIIILIINLLKEWHNHFSLFNKFLLERMLYNFSFYKNKIIKGLNLNKMMRDKRHLFYNNGIYKTEKEVVKERYKK